MPKVIKEIERKYYKYVDTSWTQPTLSIDKTLAGGIFSVQSDNTSAIYPIFNQTGIWRSGTSWTFWFYNPELLKISNLALKNGDSWASAITGGTLYGSVDGVTYDTLATFGGSTTNVTLNVPVNTNNYYKYFRVAGSAERRGVYLTQCTITATQRTITDGTASNYDFYRDILGYKTIKNIKIKYYKNGTTPNVTLVGSPTVSNGVVSNFSSSSYGKLKNIFNPLSSTWEMVFKITTPSSFGNQGFFLGGGVTSGADWQAVTLGIDENGKTYFYLSSNGSSWDIAINTIGTTQLVVNTDYYFRLKFTGSAYTLETSTDKETWTTENTITSSTPVYVSSQPFCVGGTFYTSENAKYWRGSVDLKESYIKINDEIWWAGTKPVEATPSNYDYIKRVDTMQLVEEE